MVAPGYTSLYKTKSNYNTADDNQLDESSLAYLFTKQDHS